MSTKSLLVVSVISFAASSLLQAQSPTPAESPAASPAKHRTHKKAEATASPAAVTEASPSPAAKHGHKTKTTAEASPSPAEAAVYASPAAKGGRKTQTTATAPVVSPSPSPAKILADFFKPKTSASPAAAGAPAARVAQATPAPGGGHGLVWVNTETHVYHKEGTRFYGKTKKGKYVTEQEAIKEGDKAAKRE
jgi:hypothetical protein